MREFTTNKCSNQSTEEKNIAIFLYHASLQLKTNKGSALVMVGYYYCRVLTLVQPVKQFSAKATFSQGILSFCKCVVKVKDKSLNSKSFFSNWFQNSAIDPNLTKPNVLMLSTAYWYRCLCNISITSPQSRRFDAFNHTGQQEESGQARRKGGGSRLSKFICR
jgi:hypothetical protein